MKKSHLLTVVFTGLLLFSLTLKAQESLELEALDAPPPGDVFVAAKIDPKTYKFTAGLESGWAFANPFLDDFSLGINLNYVPLPQLRLGVVASYHVSKSTGLAKQVNTEIGLKDRKLRLAKPQMDFLAHLELRAIHGLVKLFYLNTLDYEAGLFLRIGSRKSQGTSREWDLLLVPGISQTLLYSNSFNIRLLLSAELQNYRSTLVTQGALIQGGVEWRN